jgi:hypothetical protein
MGKRPISVTLRTENLTWLKARVGAVGSRSVSDLIDQLVASARKAAPGGAIRSVVGTIDIAADDPLLEGADAVLRVLVESSLKRPGVVKESGRSYRSRRRGLPRG